MNLVQHCSFVLPGQKMGVTSATKVETGRSQKKLHQVVDLLVSFLDYNRLINSYIKLE